MSLRNIIFFIIGAGLTACSFALHKTVSSQSVPVNNTLSAKNVIDSIVDPYKVKLDVEMNEKVAYAEVNFINERINGNLGNMVTDVLLEQSKKIQVKEAFCLINFGGLRSTINKGDVLLTDIFKLLPFDNYLVLVNLKEEGITEMKDWILRTGGQPIAGFYIDKGVMLDSERNPVKAKDYWVLTSDYLLNGGDKATFFQKNNQVIQTNLLLRDVFLEGIRDKVLVENKEQRIILE